MTASEGRGASRRRVLKALWTLPLLFLSSCDDDARKAEPSPSAPASPGSAAASSTYFPPATGEWERVAPEQAGFSSAGIRDVVKLAEESHSTTFMMLWGGRILTEDYFGSATAETVQDVASVQKSVVSTLIGIARERGLLGLDDPVSRYLPAGWSRAGPAHEGAVTIRHLMTHSSGLDPRTLRSVAEPGAVFDYNTNAYQKLRPLLETAVGQDLNTISRDWLFDKAGSSATAVWRVRPFADTDPTGASLWGLYMNARDMARFGLLALRRGQWAGASVVKPEWFDEAWAPSPVQPYYGLLWWLIGKGRVRAPGVPDDWVAALGAMDQKVYVVPSMDLVLTRQGRTAREESENTSSFDAVLFRAMAAARD